MYKTILTSSSDESDGEGCSWSTEHLRRYRSTPVRIRSSHRPPPGRSIGWPKATPLFWSGRSPHDSNSLAPSAKPQNIRFKLSQETYWLYHIFEIKFRNWSVSNRRDCPPKIPKCYTFYNSLLKLEKSLSRFNRADDFIYRGPNPKERIPRSDPREVAVYKDIMDSGFQFSIHPSLSRFSTNSTPP